MLESSVIDCEEGSNGDERLANDHSDSCYLQCLIPTTLQSRDKCSHFIEFLYYFIFLHITQG